MATAYDVITILGILTYIPVCIFIVLAVVFTIFATIIGKKIKKKA